MAPTAAAGDGTRARRQSTAEKTTAAWERAVALEREKGEKRNKTGRQQRREGDGADVRGKRPASAERAEPSAKRGRPRASSGGKEAAAAAEHKEKRGEGAASHKPQPGGRAEKAAGGDAAGGVNKKPAQGQHKEGPAGNAKKRATELEKTLVESQAGLSPNALEKGHIYFFYRPKVQHAEAHSKDDVARMYILLKPVASRPTGVAVDKQLQASEIKKNDSRLFIIAKKKLPNTNSHERFWGFVKKASKDVKQLDDFLKEDIYETKTRGTRDAPAARALGAGVYSIVVYHNNTHLSYVLKAPETPADVQESFNVKKEGSYVLSVRNPDTPSPPQAGLSGEAKASFPKHLKDAFGGRRFVSVDPVEFLDHDGCEVLLIGAHKDVGPMGSSADELFSLGAAEEKKIKAVGKNNAVFTELRADGLNFSPEPLFGTWA